MNVSLPGTEQELASHSARAEALWRLPRKAALLSVGCRSSWAGPGNSLPGCSGRQRCPLWGVFPPGQGRGTLLQGETKGEAEARVVRPCGGECMMSLLCMAPLSRRSACVCARPVSGLGEHGDRGEAERKFAAVIFCFPDEQ